MASVGRTDINFNLDRLHPSIVVLAMGSWKVQEQRTALKAEGANVILRRMEGDTIAASLTCTRLPDWTLIRRRDTAAEALQALAEAIGFVAVRAPDSASTFLFQIREEVIRLHPPIQM